MKFAIIHPSLKAKGGAENVVIWLAEGLVKRGQAVTVITSDYDEDFYGPIRDKSFKIKTLKLYGYAMSPLKFFLAGVTLSKELGKYDVVNPHNFPAYIWCYIAQKINPKIQKIIWFCEEPMRMFYRDIIDEHVRMLPQERSGIGGENHLKSSSASRMENRGLIGALKSRLVNKKNEFNFWLAKKIDQFIVPRLDQILTNSQFIAANIQKIFGRPALPCLLGIPPDRFHNSSSRVGLHNYMLTVARLYPEKNVENIIRAVKILIDERRFDFERYFIAGSGPLEDHLGQVISNLKLEKEVKLLGFVSEEELSRLYRGAALIVYLSLDETYGLVFPEAAFYRKPVVGPNHGGPTELIIDGKTGVLVDPLSSRKIAQGIKKIMSMDYKKMGENGYNNYFANLTFDKFRDRFLKIIIDR